MVKEATVRFVRENREELQMIAENGSESASRIAEAFLAAVPGEDGQKSQWGVSD